MEDLMNFNSPMPIRGDKETKQPANELISFDLLDTSNHFNAKCKNVFDINHEPVPLCGRESLAIDTFQFTEPFELGRESLPFSGRESLFPLIVIDAASTSFEPINDASVDNTLNVGFLHPKSLYTNRKQSAYSSTSSNPSAFDSFQLNSLASSEPSPINSLHSFNHFEFNKGFLIDSQAESPQTDHNSLLNKHLINEEMRKRIQSLPTSTDCCITSNNNNNNEKVRSISLELGLEGDEAGDAFNDSLFIEAHHLACKFADGSILDSSEDGNILDCTPQPNFNDLSANEAPKCDTETVFKAVDKMLPPLNQSDNSINKQECVQNLSDAFKLPSRNSSNASANSTKEIIHNLSMILNSGHRNSEQKRAGQSLLLNLADILYASDKSNSLNDSGHSSIDEVFASTSNVEPPKISAIVNKRSQSFSVNCANSTMSNKLKAQTAHMKKVALTSSSSNSLRPKKSSSSDAFVIPKNGPMKAVIAINNMAKDNKAKDNKGKDNKAAAIQTTPTRNNKSLCKTKRTSTPIADPKLKPMAQSTPESVRNNKLRNSTKPPCSTLLKKRNLRCPISPLVRANSLLNSADNSETHTNSNRSGSAPDLSNASSNNNSIKHQSNSITPNMSRRYSASDLKRPPLNAAPSRIQLRRSCSTAGKENAKVAKNPPVNDKLGGATNVTAKLHKLGATLKENINKNNRSSIGRLIKPINLAS